MTVSGTERHRLVLTDPAAHRIVWLDGEGNIEREITDVHSCFEVFVLPGGQVLYPHFGSKAPSDGFSLVNPDGSVALVYHTKREVFSCQPLPNGNVLVGELHFKIRVIDVAHPVADGLDLYRIFLTCFKSRKGYGGIVKSL